MVVKIKPGSEETPAAADPLRGVSDGPTTSPTRVAKAKETEVEFSRLKKLVPAISKKQSVSKLDVILEAIRYIDQLQDQLVTQLSSREDGLSVASNFIEAGKENATVSESAILQAISEKRRRHKSQ